MADQNRNITCALCNRRVCPVQYRMRVNTPLWNVIVLNNLHLAPFHPDSPICKKCYTRYHKMLPTENYDPIVENSPPEEVASPFSMRLPTAALSFDGSSTSGSSFCGTSVAGSSIVGSSPTESSTSGPSTCGTSVCGSSIAGSPVQRPLVQIPFEVNAQLAQPQLHQGYQNQQEVRILPSSENHCCVCLAASRKRIDSTVRAQVWHHGKIVIPVNNRICENHLDITGFLDQISLNQVFARCLIKNMDVGELAQYLSRCLHKSFDAYATLIADKNPTINVLSSDSDCKCYTGLSLLNFLDLCRRTNMPEYSEEFKIKAISVLLCKLRMGNSQDQLAHLFGISQPTISRYIELASNAIDAHFVPLHLGYRHITRNEYVQNHQNSMIRILHEILPGCAGVLLDGTYFEVEKSSNYNFQKISFSLQKHYNLVKFMYVVAPDGYILDIFGPSGSDHAHNDASLFNRMLADVNGFTSFFQANDVLIVDRGFRDSVNGCRELGLRVAMPPFLAGRRQFEREEADYSRFVTKVRWVIESVNGRVKNVFAFYRHQIPNMYINKLGKFMRITAALLNAYFVPIYPDRPEQIRIANFMIEKARMSNEVQEQIQALGLHEFNNQYVLTTAAEIVGFPQLTEEDLRDITVGIYQLENAASYAAYHLFRTNENIDEPNNFQVFKHQFFDGIVLVRMESRHVQIKVHNALISFIPRQNGIEGIHAYFCSCQVGKRFVGMCSHTAAVLWLLSYAIPMQQYRPPANNIDAMLVNLRL